jgi:hypothetical protein
MASKTKSVKVDPFSLGGGWPSFFIDDSPALRHA